MWTRTAESAAAAVRTRARDVSEPPQFGSGRTFTGRPDADLLPFAYDSKPQNAYSTLRDQKQTALGSRSREDLGTLQACSSLRGGTGRRLAMRSLRVHVPSLRAGRMQAGPW